MEEGNNTGYPISPVLAQHVSAEVSIRGWAKEENEKLITLAQDQRKKWTDISPYFPSKTVEQCINHWFNELMPKLLPNVARKWTKDEDAKLIKLVQQCSKPIWPDIARSFPGRNPEQCRSRWRKQLKPEFPRKEEIMEEENNTGHPNKRPRIELSDPVHASSQLQENSSSNNLSSLQNVQQIEILESSLHHSEVAIKSLQEIQSMYPHPLLQSIQQEMAQCLANVQTTYQEIRQKPTAREDCSSIIKQALSLADFSLINARCIKIVYQHFISYQTNQELKEWFSSQNREFLDLYLVFLKGKINELNFHNLMSLKERDYFYKKLTNLFIQYRYALIKNSSYFSSYYNKYINDFFSGIELNLTLLKCNQQNWRSMVSSLEEILSRLQEIEFFFTLFLPFPGMESHIIARIKNEISSQDLYDKQTALIMNSQSETRETEDFSLNHSPSLIEPSEEKHQQLNMSEQTLPKKRKPEEEESENDRPSKKARTQPASPFHESSQLQEGISSNHSSFLPSDQDFSGDFPDFFWSQENLYSNDSLSSSSHPEDSLFLDLFGDNPPQEF